MCTPVHPRERERGDNAAERRGNQPAFRGCQDIFLATPPCMHNACTCEGERKGAGSAADSLRGENSKSFAVTIFLIASPSPPAATRSRRIVGAVTVVRTVPVTPSRKDVGINKMIWWLCRRCVHGGRRYPRFYPTRYQSRRTHS